MQNNSLKATPGSLNYLDERTVSCEMKIENMGFQGRKWKYCKNAPRDGITYNKNDKLGCTFISKVSLSLEVETPPAVWHYDSLNNLKYS